MLHKQVSRNRKQVHAAWLASGERTPLTRRAGGGASATGSQRWLQCLFFAGPLHWRRAKTCLIALLRGIRCQVIDARAMHVVASVTKCLLSFSALRHNAETRRATDDAATCSGGMTRSIPRRGRQTNGTRRPHLGEEQCTYLITTHHGQRTRNTRTTNDLRDSNIAK